jgi:hypothetical protein
MHVVDTCRSGGIIIRVVHVSDDRQTKHASDFFDPQKRQPFQAPRRSQASQRRFLQPNPSKRAPRSTPLGAFHPKSLFSPFSSPTTLLLTPDNPIRTASLQTPPTPPARLSPPTHTTQRTLAAEDCLVVSLRRAKHPIYLSLYLPPSSSPRRTHALQIASLASPDHSTVANRSPTASRGLRTVRSPQPLVSCCTFASLEMASKVCMLRRPPPVDANGSAPCATVQHWRPTTQDLC